MCLYIRKMHTREQLIMNDIEERFIACGGGGFIYDYKAPIFIRH